MNKKLYLEAKKNPNLRQEFCDSIKLGKLGEYITHVIYNPQPNEQEKEIVASTSFLFPGQKSKIICFPLIFEDKRISLDDPEGIILDHEGFHATDIYKSHPLVLNHIKAEDSKKEDLKNYFYSLIEIRALTNQVINITKRNFSENYKTRLFKYMDYFTALNYSLSKKLKIKHQIK